MSLELSSYQLKKSYEFFDEMHKKMTKLLKYNQDSIPMYLTLLGLCDSMECVIPLDKIQQCKEYRRQLNNELHLRLSLKGFRPPNDPDASNQELG